MANPIQARTLLRAVGDVKWSRQRLVACYAAMYYAALRTEEAIDLRDYLLTLPESEWDKSKELWVHQWGKVYVEDAAPHAGKSVDR